MKNAAYGKCKSSGTDWLGNVPTHWSISPLKYVADIKTGYAFSSDDFTDEGIPVLRISDITKEGKVDLSSAKFLPIEYANMFRAVTLKSEGIVMAMTGATIGKVGRYELQMPCLLNQRVCSFEAIKNNDQKYLWYLLNADFYIKHIALTAFGGAQPNISDTQLLACDVPLPPLAEQQAIARFLDAKTAQIDALVAQKRQLIAKLKEKRSALIARTVTRGLPPEAARAAGLEPNPEMKPLLSGWADECPVHWQTWKISHGFGLTGSGTTPPSDNEEWYEGDIPWVTTGELRESIITDTNKKVSRAAIKEFSALKIFPAGSLAIAMYGATIGRLGIFGVAATTNQACCVLAKERAFERDFVFYWLQAFRDQIVMLATGGGQPNISQEKIRSLRIPCPSVHEQQIISKYLREESDKIDQLVNAAESAIERINELRQALITSAVTGKIDVREVA